MWFVKVSRIGICLATVCKRAGHFRGSLVFQYVSIQQSYCGQLNLTALVRLAFFLTHLPCVCVTESTLAAEEDFLDSFLSDLIDSSDDGKPAGPEPPTPPKRRIRHKSKGPRPTCVEDGACDPSYFRSLEGFEKFWMPG